MIVSAGFSSLYKRWRGCKTGRRALPLGCGAYICPARVRNQGSGLTASGNDRFGLRRDLRRSSTGPGLTSKSINVRVLEGLTPSK